MNAIRFLSDQPWVERLGWTLANFLWQGVVIAVFYAAARRALPGANRAQARYVLACAALAGTLAAPAVTFRVLNTAQTNTAYPYAGKVPVTSAAAVPVRNSIGASFNVPSSVRGDAVMPWVVLAWFGGAAVFWIRLTAGWFAAARLRKMSIFTAPARWQRTLDTIRIQIGVSRPVTLLISALVQAPAAVGWLRPLVLIPAGMLSGLPPEHIEMLLAHELAHIRRRDYLINILQRVAEALLFYHPAVWWISGHIRAEREFCCDDVAVSARGDALTYAHALAGLASQPRHSMNAALAANGGSLPERIGRLLNHNVRRSRSGPGASVAAAVLLALGTWALSAQSQPAKREFEAVSIKPNNLGGGHSHSHTSPGRLDAKMTTKSVIEMAFGIKSFQIAGGPGWLDESNYDIVATTGNATRLTDEVLQSYLQSLLSGRFHLVYHRESKELPAYALAVTKNGPKLTPHTGAPGEGTNSNSGPGGIHMTGTDLTMAHFAGFLANRLDRPVIDRTGIRGTFDVTLDWSSGDADATLPSIFSALQDQLGLRLSATKGPVEILVVDSVDKPTEN